MGFDLVVTNGIIVCLFFTLFFFFLASRWRPPAWSGGSSPHARETQQGFYTVFPPTTGCSCFDDNVACSPANVGDVSDFQSRRF